jgi:proline iminopeptidase
MVKTMWWNGKTSAGRAVARTRWGVPLLLLALTACGGGEPPASAGEEEGGSRFTEGLLPVNGTELYVRQMGSGPAVMVVHGGPLLEQGYLVPFLEPLADDHRLVFFDQRLSGRSAGTVAPESVRADTLVADMEAIRAALDLEEMTLLAHSWGSFLALRYALSYPERVAGLVLVSPMAASSSLRQEEEARVAGRVTEAHAEETRRLRADPDLQAGDPEALAGFLRHSFRLQLHDPDRVSELPLYVPADYLQRSRQFGSMMVDLAEFDVHDGLRGLPMPALILYGVDEPGADLGGEALVAALPKAELVRVPEAGHFAFLERPDVFMEHVRRFLEGS